MSKSNIHKVHSNLLQQNCYLRDCSRLFDLSTSYSDDAPKYVSLDEVSSDTGFKQEYVEYPYPHTPSSVDSYREGADYRLDPQSHIIDGRQNLGDIRDQQDLLNKNSADLLALYQQLQKVFEIKPETKPETEPETKPEIKSDVGGEK
ncbi:hypothetical protein [Dipodfec virus UA06Rod_17]|uniref:Uncharacterized protein n=1 Tax=Dipodfec virus UA06Rod_17 TaxID=2929318 RepID=A0A976N2C1_9VIRU|nr:hypothetical protein [Dipodfec virus UA06Rod_17]